MLRSSKMLRVAKKSLQAKDPCKECLVIACCKEKCETKRKWEDCINAYSTSLLILVCMFALAAGFSALAIG